jgi:hypothetical protein
LNEPESSLSERWRYWPVQTAECAPVNLIR